MPRNDRLWRLLLSEFVKDHGQIIFKRFNQLRCVQNEGVRGFSKICWFLLMHATVIRVFRRRQSGIPGISGIPGEQRRTACRKSWLTKPESSSPRWSSWRSSTTSVLGVDLHEYQNESTKYEPCMKALNYKTWPEFQNTTKWCEGCEGVV